MFKSFSGVGVELEGLWYGMPDDFKEDGSVEFDDHHGYNDCGCYESSCEECSEFVSQEEGRYVGEVASDILYTENAIDSFMKWEHPDQVNYSCGLHVHTSFRNIDDYSRLTSKHFYDYFKKELFKWGQKNCPNKATFFSRLAGENTYCETGHYPSRQMGLDEGYSRYAILNYCWQDHNTIECRVLPMFQDKLQSLEAVKAVLTIYEKYLSNPKNDWESAGKSRILIPKGKRKNARIEKYQVSKHQ